MRYTISTVHCVCFLSVACALPSSLYSHLWLTLFDFVLLIAFVKPVFVPLQDNPLFHTLFISQQNMYYTSSQQLHLGVLSPTIDDDDNKCLVDVNSRPRLLECSYAATKHMKLTWTFTQVNHNQTKNTVVQSRHIKLQLCACFTHFRSSVWAHCFANWYFVCSCNFLLFFVCWTGVLRIWCAFF